MVNKTIHEINAKIRDGSVNVVTAEEMVDIVQELGAKDAAREVDVVTTGTFGAMCSSGVWFNFGHSEPPIKMQKVWMNDVEAYTGVAAVDAYLGAAQLSDSLGLEYGGAHVIEDLLRGKAVDLHAISHGTDCYPRKVLDTSLTLADMNQALMFNPRNAYQKYSAATNSSRQVIHTYMGSLLPRLGNVTYSGAGVLSPLSNDPEYRTIGTGTRIFLGGAQGYVTGAGTQHSPAGKFGTLMVQGDLKRMDPEYIRAANFTAYGTSLYVGIGIPIPVLDENIARCTAIRDADIRTSILDYSVPSRDKPVLREVTYEELRSGFVELEGRNVATSSLSSFKKARKIASELRSWISKGDFFVSMPVERLPQNVSPHPMKETEGISFVSDIMAIDVVTISMDASVFDAAKIIMETTFNHLPVVSKDKTLVGIVTAWDISKAVYMDKFDLVEDIMTRKVITAKADEQVAVVARRLDQNRVSALPVVSNRNEVIGMITSDDISKLFGRRQ